MGSRLLLLTCLSLLISACARQPLREIEDFDRYQRRLAAIEDWELWGKMNLRVPGDSETVRVNWRNAPGHYSIRLSGALGMGATWIKGDAWQVRLEQSGEEPIVAATPEDLVYTLLGRQIPISELRYWIRGLPAPAPKPTSFSFSPEGVLTQLEQSGWQLSFSDYRAVGSWNLPGKILATRDDLRLTMLISDWSIEGDDPRNLGP